MKYEVNLKTFFTFVKTGLFILILLFCYDKIIILF